MIYGFITAFYLPRLFMNDLSKFMYLNKSDLDIDRRVNPKDTKNSKEMQDVMKNIFSFENFVYLNSKVS